MKRNTDVSVAILQTDLIWIKNKLSTIDETMNKINLCTSTHDSRIQSLEEWRKVCVDELNKSMIKWSIVISAIAIAVSTVLHFV